MFDNPRLVRLPELNLGSLQRVHVERNPALEQGPSFPRVGQLDQLVITENAVLTRLDGFASLQRAGDIQVSRNAALTWLAFPGLTAVSCLTITCNPLLEESSLASLSGLSAEAELAGNLRSTAPCPGSP